MHQVTRDQIYIIDNLASASLQKSLTDMMHQAIWKYGWHSSSRRDRFAFWHAHGAGGGSCSRTDCTEELSKNETFGPVFTLWKLLWHGPLREHSPLRVYINAHTYGVEGYVHRDSSDQDNYWTTVYFAHAKWDTNWVGELVFFDDDDDVIHAVFPKPGRIVIFPGALRHCARGVSRECPSPDVPYTTLESCADGWWYAAPLPEGHTMWQISLLILIYCPESLGREATFGAIS